MGQARARASLHVLDPLRIPPGPFAILQGPRPLYVRSPTAPLPPQMGMHMGPGLAYAMGIGKRK